LPNAGVEGSIYPCFKRNFKTSRICKGGHTKWERGEEGGMGLGVRNRGGPLRSFGHCDGTFEEVFVLISAAATERGERKGEGETGGKFTTSSRRPS